MVGMRSDDEIMRAFDGLQMIPGSKTPRISPSPVAKKASDEEWDSNPIIKKVGGVDTELFTISALAMALGKSIVTIRQWEQRGYIPQSPYRLRQKSLKGQRTAGNRVYTRPLVVAAIEEFSNRGLLGKARVEWKDHEDLTIALHARWSRIINQ